MIYLHFSPLYFYLTDLYNLKIRNALVDEGMSGIQSMGKVVSIANALTVRISLDGIKPSIWRRFAVRDDISLLELHEIIQTVMGWTNTHLFSFFINKTEYTDEETIDELGRGKNADKVTVRSLKLKKGDTFKYVYDFGDDWSHKLKIESVSDPDPEIEYPVCLNGARECPPEDCGGPFGYEQLLEILDDPEHAEHEAVKEWTGADFDPDFFDVELTNELLHTDFEDEDYFLDEDFEDGPYGDLKKTSRENMHAIWEAARNNRMDDLSDEDKLLARIMLEHEDEFFNNFEFADIQSERVFDPESEVNPFLHITVHAVIEDQLTEKEPVEVYQFYNSMRNKKVSHHDAVHLISAMLTPLMFSIFKEKQEFDLDLYKSLLKRCKNKRPDRIPEFIDREFESYFGG
jgi:hypothetical protein